MTAPRLIENNLSGELPPEIGGLSRLHILRLSNNRLSGEIPSEISDMSILRGLRLGWLDESHRDFAESL